MFFLGEDKSYFRRNSAKFLVEFQMLENFLSLIYQMSCGLLIGFQETETHSRARDGCHMSTL